PRVRFALAVWVLLVGFYVLFAGQVSPSELIAGIPAAGAAAVFALLLHRTQTRRLRLRAPWLHVLAQPLGAVFPDALRVGGVLLRALWHRPAGSLGQISRQPFNHGGDDASAAARRGLVTLANSLAPNGYVLRIPDDGDVLLLHRLAPTPTHPEREWPL
ncbi:MAG: hypothetical protein M3Y41_08550, partial [Pseudomonadota bacterium]|nr:hypothetical protein [Pseudomonadota bacterium]